MSRELAFAACVDRAGVAGLEVLVRSIAASNAWNWQLLVIHDRLPNRTRQRISAIRLNGGRIDWHSINSTQHFKGRVVYGLMTYARLLVPRVAESPFVIYLDTDMVVTQDLREMPALDGFVIGAVREKIFENSNCKHFFEAQEVNLQTPYFNAGLLSIDCEKWRELRTEEELFRKAREMNWEFPSGDQTLLNWHFDGQFQPLPSAWNQLAYAAAPPLEDCLSTPGIVHFIGRPKPWEFGGFVNRQYSVFARLSTLYSLRTTRPEIRLLPHILGRICRYLPSYAKSVLNRRRG